MAKGRMAGTVGYLTADGNDRQMLHLPIITLRQLTLNSGVFPPPFEPLQDTAVRLVKGALSD